MIYILLIVLALVSGQTWPIIVALGLLVFAALLEIYD